MATCRQVYSQSVAPSAPESLPLIFQATEVKSTCCSLLALSAHKILLYNLPSAMHVRADAALFACVAYVHLGN